MDRLLRLEPSNRVVVRIEPGKRCCGCLTLRNAMYTMPVAYRLLALNRARFLIRPQTGIIAPLATLTVEINYLPPPPPAPLLPESAPESDESFSLDSVIAPGASVKDGAAYSLLDSVPVDWFTAKKKQVFSDSGVRLFFVGSAVLCRLVANGDMEKVREVLEFSDREWHSADSVDARGQTLLHLAISRGRADLVQLILEFDANVNATNLAGRSALEAAAAVGEVLIAELLLARGASTQRSPWSIWGPLHHAAAAGHLELLQLLLLHGAAPDLPAADGLTALHLAAEERRRECVAALLSAGARADASGGAAGYTALHVAAETGDEATARLLVEEGCAGIRETRNSAGMTAYDVAEKEGHRRLFGLLRLGESLAVAARKGEVRTVARAVEKGAAVDWRDGNGWTPLMIAGFKGRVETMRFLLEKGAAVDAKDEEGYTALHCAVEAGQVEAVDMLVKRGAEIEARTSKGRTAMDIATWLGYAGIVRILLQGGASKVAPAPVAATRVVGTLAMAAAKEKVGKRRILREIEAKKKGGRMVEREGGGVLFRAGFVDGPTAKAVASY